MPTKKPPPGLLDDGFADEGHSSPGGESPFIPRRKRGVNVKCDPYRALQALNDCLNDLRRCGTPDEITANANRGRAIAEILRTYFTIYDIQILKKQYEDLDRDMKRLKTLHQSPPHDGAGFTQ